MVEQENIIPAAQPAPAPVAEPDMSKTTITVLVLLTLMISIIGTWTVLNEISSVQTQHPTATSVGHVSFTIGQPGQPAQSNPTAATTGKVVFSITQ